MTPREAAINFIKPYVDRGDTIEDLKSSRMGHMEKGLWVEIGGYVNHKNIGSNKILVKELNGKIINEVFNLTELYNEIKKGKP